MTTSKMHRTDTAESITSITARAALRRYCKGKKKKDVAKEMGWLPSYLSAFLNSRSVAGYGTVIRIQKLVAG